MKKAVYAILTLALIVGMVLWITHNKPEDSLQSSMPGDRFMYALSQSPGAILIDVRTPEEFEEGHIQGAHNIDFYNPHFRDAIAALDPSGTYFIYCHSGNRSRQALEVFHSLGIQNVTELAGGIGANPSLISH